MFYFLRSELTKHSVTKIVLIFHCLNKVFKWSQNFCKFSIFSLEFQKLFSMTRTIYSHSRSEQFWKQNINVCSKNMPLPNWQKEAIRFHAILSNSYHTMLFDDTMILVLCSWSMLNLLYTSSPNHDKNSKNWDRFTRRCQKTKKVVTGMADSLFSIE